MTTTLDWREIAVRLLLAILAGACLGLNRGRHGRPAGLRTTMLVSLAACLSMIQANLLLPTAGKSASSFVQLDVMRLPLGILSGMGFIGAGAIVRRDNFVTGVTTAATLWFVTVLGLCFGGGQLVLGLAGTTVGFLILAGLKTVEAHWLEEHRGVLVIASSLPGLSDEDLGAELRKDGFEIKSLGVTYHRDPESREFRYDVRWRAKHRTSEPPRVIRVLATQLGTIHVRWTPEQQ